MSLHMTPSSRKSTQETLTMADPIWIRTDSLDTFRNSKADTARSSYA